MRDDNRVLVNFQRELEQIFRSVPETYRGRIAVEAVTKNGATLHRFAISFKTFTDDHPAHRHDDQGFVAHSPR